MGARHSIVAEALRVASASSLVSSVLGVSVFQNPSRVALTWIGGGGSPLDSEPKALLLSMKSPARKTRDRPRRARFPEAPGTPTTPPLTA